MRKKIVFVVLILISILLWFLIWTLLSKKNTNIFTRQYIDLPKDDKVLLETDELEIVDNDTIWWENEISYYSWDILFFRVHPEYKVLKELLKFIYRDKKIKFVQGGGGENIFLYLKKKIVTPEDILKFYGKKYNLYEFIDKLESWWLEDYLSWSCFYVMPIPNKISISKNHKVCPVIIKISNNEYFYLLNSLFVYVIYDNFIKEKDKISLIGNNKKIWECYLKYKYFGLLDKGCKVYKEKYFNSINVILLKNRVCKYMPSSIIFILDKFIYDAVNIKLNCKKDDIDSDFIKIWNNVYFDINYYEYNLYKFYLIDKKYWYTFLKQKYGVTYWDVFYPMFDSLILSYFLNPDNKNILILSR